MFLFIVAVHCTKGHGKAEKFFGAELRYPSSAVFQADEVIFMSVASRQKKPQFHKQNLSMPKISPP